MQQVCGGKATAAAGTLLKKFLQNSAEFSAFGAITTVFAKTSTFRRCSERERNAAERIGAVLSALRSKFEVFYFVVCSQLNQ
jgi:hypothetical protein